MFRRSDVIFIVIALLGLLAWAVFGFPSCEPSGNSGQLPALKKEIASAKLERDSIKFRVDTVYRYRIKYKTRYEQIRHDSIVPCETKLLICDTLVVKDSTLIAELTALVKQDSVVIAKQDTLIRAQDLTIIDLTKKVKRERRRTKFAIVIAGLLAGLAIAK